jgi:uncharacterized membrane protein
MAALLANLRNTVIVSAIFALIFIGFYFTVYGGGADQIFWQAVLRWLHVICGIMWIGLLWYFNFVQTRMMPQIPAELKPGVSKYIAPEALFWFRYGALFTWILGVLLAWNRGFLIQAYTLDAYDPVGGTNEAFKNHGNILIGVGMWLATIMFINVWALIWPNQKKVLGLVPADDAAKATAARIAGQASRINTLLSFPMLVAMTMHQTLILH